MHTLVAGWRHEFRMQLRKPTLWGAMLALGLIFLTLPVDPAPARQLKIDIAQAAVKLNWLAPMLLGALLADRLVRDRRLRVTEILDTTGASPGARLWGKYLGAVTGCLVPLAVVWLTAVVRFAVVRHDPAALPWGALAFVAIQVPALLFVGAFALACPAVLGAPLFRVLFVGYWLWGNLVSPTFMPTLSGTPLTPMGDYARRGLFGGRNAAEGSGIGAPDTAGQEAAWLSLALLVGLAMLCLVTFQIISARRAATR